MRDVSDHYTVEDLGSRILAALESAGKNVNDLSVDDLAPVDAFHVRGRRATEELVEWAGVGGDDSLLDVGSGLGGTGRYLASRTGCAVVGVDLTEEYCRVAEMLSERVGLAGRATFTPGSALGLPFHDGVFDVVWTEHVQMNIADKRGFYGEAARVMKPAGKFAFHDILAGDGGEPRFPVPWAADASINHLIGVEELRRLLAGLELREIRWEDKTEASIEFFETVLGRIRDRGWAPLGLHLLMGEDAETKFDNILFNLKSDRIRVVQAVMTRR